MAATTTSLVSEELADLAAARGVRYFLISFVDLLGQNRSKLVPASAIATMQRDGAGFAGFAAWFDMSPADPDLVALPDPRSFVQLPWKREVGWVASRLHMNGALVEQGPRNTLERLLAQASARGLTVKTGVECEFFLIKPDGTAIGDAADIATKPCYDSAALMRRYDVIAEICDAMAELGWAPYQNDHEDANGQFEMNWQFDEGPDDGRSTRLLQIPGAFGGREARPARDIHAKALCDADRERMPHAYLVLGR